MSVIWTQTDIDTLKAAIASGVLSVTYDGPPRRSVTYQSISQMLQVLGLAAQAIDVQNGGTAYRFGSYKSGL